MITGGGLLIRPLRDCTQDIENMARWLSDPRVLAFYEGRDRPHDQQLVREVFVDGKARTQEEIPCIIEWEGRPIGYVQFYPAEEEGPDCWGMDQFIGEPECWGRGIGTAMVRLVVDYLVRVKGARRVIMDPVTTNLRAIRAYEKAGFRKVRVMERHELHEGQWRDCWLMEYADR